MKVRRWLLDKSSAAHSFGQTPGVHAQMRLKTRRGDSK
jgi:hypothetical protein